MCTKPSRYEKTVANVDLDVESLLIAVGALEPNDQRLSKKDREDEDVLDNRVRSGKMFTTSAADGDADDWD